MIAYFLVAGISIGLLFLVTWWLWKKDNGDLRKFYWPALIIKIMAGVALGIIYSGYYETSDTFTFFQLAVDKAELAKTDIFGYLNFLFGKNEGYFLGEYRTLFFVKITSIFALVTGNNYWITAAYYSCISFFSAWYITKTIARLLPSYKIAACIAFLFFPSVVFWSSGVIKESLAMAALFFVAAIFIQMWIEKRISTSRIILACISIYVLFNLKYYYLAVFIPVVFSAVIAHRISIALRINSAVYQILLQISFLFFGFIVITFIHPNLSPSRLLSVIVSNNMVFMNVCTPDDVVHFHNLHASWSNLLINSPWALISGFFRPFIWEANTLFKFITALENLTLIIFTVLALFSVKPFKDSSQRLLAFSVILYCIVLCVFLTLSTPNFGTLARYRIGFLPFVVLIVVNRPFINRLLIKLL